MLRPRPETRLNVELQRVYEYREGGQIPTSNDRSGKQPGRSNGMCGHNHFFHLSVYSLARVLLETSGASITRDDEPVNQP